MLHRFVTIPAGQCKGDLTVRKIDVWIANGCVKAELDESVRYPHIKVSMIFRKVWMLMKNARRPLSFKYSKRLYYIII